jgi:hypothetical protein
LPADRLTPAAVRRMRVAVTMVLFSRRERRAKAAKFIGLMTGV